MTPAAEADHLVFTFSSNFGQAAMFLAASKRNMRPSFISMDDVFEGFRYYGFQLKLVHDHATGLNDIQVAR